MDASDLGDIWQERMAMGNGDVAILQNEADVLGQRKWMGCVLVQVPLLQAVYVGGHVLKWNNCWLSYTLATWPRSTATLPRNSPVGTCRTLSA